MPAPVVGPTYQIKSVKPFVAVDALTGKRGLIVKNATVNLGAVDAKRIVAAKQGVFATEADAKRAAEAKIMPSIKPVQRVTQAAKPAAATQTKPAGSPATKLTLSPASTETTDNK